MRIQLDDSYLWEPEDRKRAEQLCEMFNNKYGASIDSPHRQRLLELLKQVEPLWVEILKEAKIIHKEERNRFDKAISRFLTEDDITDEDEMLLDDTDSPSHNIWWVCDKLTGPDEDAGDAAPSMDDKSGYVGTLIRLLEQDEK